MKDTNDMDKEGFKVEDQNQNHGKSITTLHCDQHGFYKIGTKINLLPAIFGDPIHAM